MIEKNSELIGCTVDDIQKEFDTRIFIIFRSGLSIIAADNILIEEGDILIVHSQKMVKKKKLK